jgi:glycosyltransferase involved in cell wall biosynthesis
MIGVQCELTGQVFQGRELAMKVVHIVESIKGGIATYLNTVLQYQSKCSDIENIGVIIPKLQVNNLIVLKNVNLHTYDYERNNSISSLVRAMLAIRMNINRICPDIIHIHSSYAGFLTRFPLFLCPTKSKIVYCAHGWAFTMEGTSTKRSSYGFIERFLAQKTNLIINISEYEYQTSLKFGLPLEKSCVIYSGSNEGVRGTVLLTPFCCRPRVHYYKGQTARRSFYLQN